MSNKSQFTSSNRLLTPIVRSDIDPLITSEEMAGVFQIFMKEWRQKHRQIIVQMAGPRGGEGTTAAAEALARAANEVTGMSAMIVSFDVERGQADIVDLPAAQVRGQGKVKKVEPEGQIAPGVLRLYADRTLQRNALTGHLRDELSGAPQNVSLIILDSQPYLSGVETAAMSSQVDAVFIVVDAEETDVSDIRRAKQAVEDSGGAVTGIILNKRRNRLPAMLARFLGRPKSRLSEILAGAGQSDADKDASDGIAGNITADKGSSAKQAG